LRGRTWWIRGDGCDDFGCLRFGAALKGLAAVALGSNLDSRFGDRRANLLEAVERIGDLGEVRVASSFYDTEPVGYLSQPRFLNAALLLATEL
jgi:2-amino-4-hydroxy-6-hydroxymethyldihydropteridine diphosphokinase